MEFEIRDAEYIELKHLLKASGLCIDSRMAKEAICQGKVLVDGQVELRKGCKIRRGQKVGFADKLIHIR